MRAGPHFLEGRGIWGGSRGWGGHSTGFVVFLDPLPPHSSKKETKESHCFIYIYIYIYIHIFWILALCAQKRLVCPKAEPLTVGHAARSTE